MEAKLAEMAEEVDSEDSEKEEEHSRGSQVDIMQLKAQVLCLQTQVTYLLRFRAQTESTDSSSESSSQCGSGRAKKAAADGAKSVRNTESEHRLISTIKAKTESTDSECYANILPQKVFQNLKEKPKLTQTSTKLTSYTGNALPIIGQCKLTCEGKDLEFFGCEQINAQFYVSRRLRIWDSSRVSQNTVRIKVDPSVRPTICPPRNQPVALKSRIKEEMDRMEQMKRNLVQRNICLDPRPLNKVILREHYQLPTLEDISTRLTGAKVFSKLDASHGYWQVPLDEESQLLITFNSLFGRYCYTRMPFGIKSVQEIFQK
ncbi:hypothetical protein EMCRGX_G031471 [Ephydatia muelleri]